MVVKKFRSGIARQGFTLVELLVVISIIALLLSILMPALSKVRESARTVVSTSNLRQLGFAVYAYSASNDGKILPSARNGAGALPALGNQNPQYAGPLWFEILKNEKLIDYTNKSSGILHCPSDKRSKLTYSYSANRNVMGFSGSTDPIQVAQDPIGMARFPVWKWTSVTRNLAGLILLGERGSTNMGPGGEVGGYWSGAGSGVWGYGGQVGDQIGFYFGRHGNPKIQGLYDKAKLTRLRVPFALADGHAEVFTKDIDCFYNPKASNYSGFEIDKAYFNDDQPNPSWPRLLPTGR